MIISLSGSDKRKCYEIWDDGFGNIFLRVKDIDILN